MRKQNLNKIWVLTLCCFHNNKVEHDLDLISEELFLNLDSNSEHNKEVNNIRPLLKERKTKADILYFFVFFLHF